MTDSIRHDGLATLPKSLHMEVIMTTGNTTVGSLVCTATAGAVGTQKIWSGSDDPKKRRSNPYTIYWDSIFRSKSRYLNCSTGNLSCYCNCGAFTAEQSWTANDEFVLINRLASKIKNSEFDVGVFVGEGRETTQMILSYLRTIRRAVTRLKRRDVFFHESLGISRDTRHVNIRQLHDDTLSGNLASAWLGTSYGLVPLMNDVFAAASEFAGHSTLRSLTVRSSFTRRVENNPSSSPTNWTCDGTRVVRGHYKYTLTEAPSYARQLGLLNPVGIMWELVPLSFCVDWVLPIGSYLESLSTLSGMTGKWERGILIRDTGKLGKLLNPKYCTAGFVSYRSRGRYTRTVGTSALSVPAPRLRGVDQLTHYVTMASLIRQRASSLAGVLNSLTNIGKRKHRNL